MSFLDSALKNAVSEEAKALESLLEMGKQKLIEAGTQLLGVAKDEVDGLTVTVTITVSKKNAG